MLSRLLWGTVALAALAAVAWALAAQGHPVLTSAAELRGERWYRLLQDERHVGYLHSRTWRDALGRWHFASDLRFVLNDGGPVRTSERLIFAAAPPHPLLRASQRRRESARTVETRLERGSDGYRSWTDGAGQRSPSAPGPLSFDLGDHLAIEAWLRAAAPGPGDTGTSATLDFGRHRVVARELEVVDRNTTGYRLQAAAPANRGAIQLDQDLRPVSMNLSSLFELRRATRAEALAPRAALPAGPRYLPVDRRLRDHAQIHRLSLRVTGAPAAELWPVRAADSVLRTTAGSLSSGPAADALGATADHPADDPRIRALARAAVADAESDEERAAALTRFVHRYLSYREDRRHRPVLSLLDDPVGDCTEHADLLTTLARALDIPSRTVFGLAYADGEAPGFRFHAWNELAPGGIWQAVDPTWNQLRVDATHLPLPADPGHALDLLTGGLKLSFEVASVEYF